MFRWLFLLLLSPLWLPYRALRRALVGRRNVRVLKLEVRGSLPDVAESSGLGARLGRRKAGTDLLTLLRALDCAGKEPGLEKVLIHLHGLHCGLARAEELRAALVRVRAAGKEVIVFAETLDLTEYWVALGGSQLCLVPTGSLNATGFSMEFTLLKGLLDKAGVRAQLLARGKYKSMAEMFTQTDISSANQEMLESLVADLAEQLQTTIASARGLSAERVKEALAQGPLRAEQALNYGLVDRLVYADELREEYKSSLSLNLNGYQKKLAARRVLPRRNARVALLRVSGNIKSGSNQSGPISRRATGSSAFVRTVRKVTDSPSVAGVILRVDSPGGSALASDVMWRELGCAARLLASKNKPFAISMGNLAASGGYYVCGLHGVEVWASPTTLTGSIGVVAGKFEASRLLARLGVKRVRIVSGPRAGYASPTTPWSDEELEKLAEDLDAAYHDFVAKMAHARDMSFEQLHALAQGRVWTGAQAHKHGLVDHVGGLHDVTVRIAEQLNSDPSNLKIWIPEERGGLSKLLSQDKDDQLLAQAASAAGLSDTLEQVQALIGLSAERVLMLLPWSLRFPRS